MAITRSDLVDRLIYKFDLPKSLATAFVDDFFGIITESLTAGEPVKFTGFGNFELKIKKARPGRNPMTGEEVIISPRRVATFKAGQKMRDRISVCN